MTPLIIALPHNESLATRIAGELEGEVGQTTLRRFPDGESYVRIDADVAGRPVILVCTLDHPDDKTLQLLFLAATARELGAASIGLVAPYLAYMRQDQRFQPGEGITSVYFARLISEYFDWMVTVDPHLHRHASLGEIYGIATRVVHAHTQISKWIAANIERPLLIGPDSESEQWVAEVARRANAPYVVLGKIRRGDLDVKISIPNVERWSGRTPVLVDDIISSARTMIETVRHLRDLGYPSPVCIGVHGIFAASAMVDLMATGVARVVTCNTIPHSSNAIDISSLVVEAVRTLAVSVKQAVRPSVRPVP